MAGGKGKSTGGKAAGPKEAATKSQKSASAKAGLQVGIIPFSKMSSSSSPLGISFDGAQRLYAL